MRACVAVLMAAWSGVGLAAGADTWIEVKSPSFDVVSNAGEGTAQKVAGEFEQVRVAYGKVWPGAHLAQGKPIVVLAVKNEGTLRRWAPGYFETRGGIDVVSGSAFGSDRVYLLLRTDYRPAEVEVTPSFNLYRAYVTLLLAGSFERRLPLWLSNGLAEVLGNTTVRDREILIGRPVPWEFQRFNRGARLPLQTILDARSDSPLVNKEDERSQFDAQSYVLAHYLLFGDRGAHSAALRHFLELWLAGRAHDQAFAQAFGDVAALEGTLPSYATTRILSYARYQADTRIEARRPPARALAPGEVAGLQAAVHVAMGRPVEAQAAIREARTADARSPASYDAEGLLADRDRDKPRATQAYGQAVELGSTNAYSHYRAAQLAWKPRPDAPALAAVRQRLERAIELNGSFADAYSYLAEVIVQQGDAAAALAPARQAVSLEPGESYHRVALARVLHKLGRAEEARKAAELGLQLARDDGQRSNAERFLSFLSESSRYEQERTRRAQSAEQASACGAGDAGACAQIIHELERGCAAGDKSACLEHAWKRLTGEGASRDESGGLSDLQKLCDEAFYPACTRLAIAEAGKPSAAARARARSLLARACEGGEQEACSLAKQLE